MSIRSLALGAAILAALFFGGWLYGLHQYRQGVNAEKVNAVLSQIFCPLQYLKENLRVEFFLQTYCMHVVDARSYDQQEW